MRLIQTTHRIRWALVVMWALVISLFSSIPSLGIPVPSLIDDLLRSYAHMTEFALFAFLLSFARSTRHNEWQFAIGVAAVYAVLDELHQTLVPGRTATISDVVVDIVGAAIGWYCWSIIRRRIQQ